MARPPPSPPSMPHRTGAVVHRWPHLRAWVVAPEAGSKSGSTSEAGPRWAMRSGGEAANAEIRSGEEGRRAYRKSCSPGDDSHQSVECANSLDEIDECVKDIYTNHILEPLCTFASPRPHRTTLKLNSSVREMLQLQDYTADAEFHLSEISLQCRTAGYLLSQTWANNASVREFLGIHKGTVPSWIRCDYDIPYTGDIQSTVNYHLDVTTRGYRSLVYSGDHDMVVPFIGTQAWIKSLNFSVVDKWRPWYVDRQVAGYTRSYSHNLTFATVKGGGHTAPEYMPRQCFAMFERWLSGDPL